MRPAGTMTAKTRPPRGVPLQGHAFGVGTFADCEFTHSSPGASPLFGRSSFSWVSVLAADVPCRRGTRSRVDVLPRESPRRDLRQARRPWSTTRTRSSRLWSRPPSTTALSHSVLGLAFQILTSADPVRLFVSRVRQAGRREPARLELLGDPRHDVPPTRRNGRLDGPREGFFDGRFVWPKRD